MFMTYRDDEEEETEDEDASIADDMLDEMEDDFAADGLDGDLETPATVEEEDDEEDVAFDAHDDVDPI